MLIDILIAVFAVSALYRGREIGFVRQLFSTAGFFIGLFLGALVQPQVSNLVHNSGARTLVTLLCTIGSAILLMTIGEYIGIRAKTRFLLKPINKVDTGFGGVLSIVSLLISVWLTAAIVIGLPLPSVRKSIQRSQVINTMNHILPPAPTVIADLGRLINPNGFPQVFIGQEPAPSGNQKLPDLGSLSDAVSKTRRSVVKLESRGCGGIVDGSGFVVGTNLVATNAHVVAGIKQPYIEDANGIHTAKVIWFDPNLDFAVLRASNLAGNSLVFNNDVVPSGTPAAVLGYPGGGGFTAGPALVTDQFTAGGRNIYGRGFTNRSIYELKADVIPGNSGGPLVAADGRVIGVIFAESTSYEHVGYALTANAVSNAIDHAVARNQVVSTGSCAE